MQGGSFLPGRVDCCVNVISANHANVPSRPILHFKENFFLSSQLWPFKMFDVWYETEYIKVQCEKF